MWYVIIGVLFWIICGILAWGILFANQQEEFKSIAKRMYRKDLSFSVSLGLLGGPVALFVALGTTGFAENGLRWW